VASDLTTRIKRGAGRLGFDAVGIVPATVSPRAAAYRDWLQAGFHAGMGWLARDPDRRSDPARVLPGARSVIVVGLSYFVENPPDALWNDPLRGRIARYAWGRDYHDAMRPMLDELAALVRSEAGRPVRCRPCVDTAPVLERDMADRAGLGFIGKNSLLIHPRIGSYLFLAELLTDLDLQIDVADTTGTCGACRRCQDTCPTRAFPSPYMLDSRRCISYLTIENKGAIDEELRPLMKNWIFGCDECQSVCPWVKRYAVPARRRFLRFDPEFAAPRLTDLMSLDEAGFRERFAGTPLLRPKRRGLLRNVAVALGNSGMAEARPALERAMQDAEPLVREHASWALRRPGGFEGPRAALPA
jgi:epoxyqueuosine reductase